MWLKFCSINWMKFRKIEFSFINSNKTKCYFIKVWFYLVDCWYIMLIWNMIRIKRFTRKIIYFPGKQKSWISRNVISLAIHSSYYYYYYYYYYSSSCAHISSYLLALLVLCFCVVMLYYYWILNIDTDSEWLQWHWFWL